MTAQRRPGREPRRHRTNPRAYSLSAPALNEGRGANPGDTRAWPPSPRSPDRALNEGRGANPGDTPSRRAESAVDLFERSTKAGARTPATQPAQWDVGQGDRIAQRRPGREPRRHLPEATASATPCAAQRRPGREPRRHPRRDHCDVNRRPARSTKAGARTPATLHPHPLVRPHHPLRSTKAGARTPATRSGPDQDARPRAALNEGRGANPGDTRMVERAGAEHVPAQRRPVVAAT